MFRQNFRARLILGAVLWISIGMGISGLVLAAIFRDVVVRHFDHELSDHADELASLLEIDPQSAPFVYRNVSDPRFLPARSGLYWKVELQNGATLRSPSLENALDLPPAPNGDNGAAQPFSVDGPTGPMRLAQKTIHPLHLKESIKVSVGADERLIDEEMKQLYLSLAMSLGIIALGLIGAAYAQIAFGLQPLVRIRQAVAAVRSGRMKQLPDDLPAEVLPLVTELNGMIAANLNMVKRARVLAGTFAHTLKMPLAILMSAGEELEQRGHTEAARVLFEQCSRINLQIDYQTARASASALANVGATSALVPVIRDVISAYSRLTSGSQKTFELSGPTGTVVACDPNDLTEIVGNLIDNAAKWSRGRIVVSVQELGNVVQILVEDDGPGIPAEHREAIFGIGTRLDEKMPGSGLGLAIAHDLATLYGGRLWAAHSRLGGAAIFLALNKIAPI